MRAALVLERHGGKAVPPGVGSGKSHRPQLFRRRVVGDFPLLAGLDVDGVDAATVGGVGESHRQLARIVLGLTNTFGQFFRVGLCFDDS